MYLGKECLKVCYNYFDGDLKKFFVFIVNWSIFEMFFCRIIYEKGYL